VYSGTKAFFTHWSQSLGVELSQHNIIVENLNAFFVVSNMSKIRRASFLTPTAKDYVQSVLSKIGLAGGSSVPFTSSPYPSHALANWAVDTFASHRIALKVNYDMHVSIRQRALKKRERESKKQ
jgi:17beta-estradiol 17-dehydrogenase / very-long-chain 3-oxoacyl-CoA reductase